MSGLAGVVGYLIGSAPTAGLLGRLRGVDLRSQGSGNPGAKNALSTGGPGLAASVLLVEAAKGYAAVWLGALIGGDQGAVLAGIGAVAGNVFNVWYRFEGGKGLGISLGVLAAAWPTVLIVAVATIAITAIVTRSAGLAALAAMASLVVSAFLWSGNEWPTGGLPADYSLFLLALGMVGVMGWKHWRDSPLNPAWRRERRTPVSPDHH